MNPIKTPTQLMYEQAGLPHFGGGGATGVMAQFAGRVADAVRKYTRITGKAPSPEEIKQLEDYIQGLSKPTGHAPATQARLGAQEPFANALVDQNGRPYKPTTQPSGQVMTPERAQGYTTSQFGTTPMNTTARKSSYLKGNAFPEDEFLSQANTGRTSNRTWQKSTTPSTEELIQRQGAQEAQMMEEPMGAIPTDPHAAYGFEEGPRSASAPLAETAAAMESGPLSQLRSDMSTSLFPGEGGDKGPYADLVQKAKQSFQSRGIEADTEDIVNAVNAMINPLRHNYTGQNPIGLRPQQTGGGRPSQSMMDWRDEARMSGLPETVVTKHPGNWKPQHQRDYLLDTAPEQRGEFAKDWTMEELQDMRRHGIQNKAQGGMIGPQPNNLYPNSLPPPVDPRHPYTPTPDANMLSTRDMQARMAVAGYAGGGRISPSDAIEELRRGPQFDNSMDRVMYENYRKHEPSMSAYEPSARERIASTGQDLLERAGIRRPIARRASDTVMGGPNSAIPGGMGLVGFTPADLPLSAQESMHMMDTNPGAGIAGLGLSTAAAMPYLRYLKNFK